MQVWPRTCTCIYVQRLRSHVGRGGQHVTHVACTYESTRDYVVYIFTQGCLSYVCAYACLCVSTFTFTCDACIFGCHMTRTQESPYKSATRMCVLCSHVPGAAHVYSGSSACTDVCALGILFRFLWACVMRM